MATAFAILMLLWSAGSNVVLFMGELLMQGSVRAQYNDAKLVLGDITVERRYHRHHTATYNIFSRY